VENIINAKAMSIVIRFFMFLICLPFIINNKPPTIVEGLLLFVYLNNYAANNWLRNVIAVLLFEKFLEILVPLTDALTRYELPSKYTLLDTGT